MYYIRCGNVSGKCWMLNKSEGLKFFICNSIILF